MGRPRQRFDEDQLRGDIEAGLTIVSIAAEHGCADVTVRNALRRYGIVRPRRLAALHPELDDPAWLRREYVDRGRPLADIGRELDPDPASVSEYLARADIPTRGHLTERMSAEVRDRDWLIANAGRSHNSFAIGLGVSPSTVTLAMRKLGVIE